MSSVKRRLPVVDFSKAKTNRKDVALTVVDGLEDVGFLYVDNVHGIDFDQLLECCRWFFNQPTEVKNKVSKKFWIEDNQNVYRGYFPIVNDNPSRKEGFEFGRDITPNDPSIATGNWFYEPSVWPKEDGKFPFKEFLCNLYEIMHETAIEILRLAAIGLDIDENTFSDMFSDKPCSTFRLIHYPPWTGIPPDGAQTEDGRQVTTPDHTDSGFITLLVTFSFAGLEYLTSEGLWEPVEPRQNSLVINIGDLLSKMVGGRFKATRHRVMDIGTDRFSVPFFLEPGYESDVGINVINNMSSDQKAERDIVKYGPWVIAQLARKNFFEFASLPKF